MEEEATKRGAKGKGKGADPGPDGHPDVGVADEKAPGDSLSYVAQSAASFLLSGRSAAGLSGTDAKGESSRVGEALVKAGESSVQLRSNIPSGQTIRTGHAGEHIAREEASFAAFLDSGTSPMLSEPSGAGVVSQTAIPQFTAPGALGAGKQPPQSVVEQQAHDGAEVVALLSSDGDLGEVFNHIDESASKEDLAALRTALFGEGADQDALNFAWDNALNFVPGYIQNPSAPGVGTGRDELSLHLGITDADEAWQAWINQWSRVLTSYQDEVWGDLGALVAEARSEVQQIEAAKPGDKLPQPTALLRLRAILGHLRGAQ